MSTTTSEPLGYLSVCQARDGIMQPEKPEPPTPRRLPERERLAQVYEANQLPGAANPRWLFLTSRPGGEAAAGRISSGRLRIGGDGRTLPRWSNERTDGFDSLQLERGFTAEARVQVSGANSLRRGFDLEIYAAGIPLTANHYLLTITPSGVYYWYDRRFVPVAEGLDNAGAPHTYRLAVREDTAAQIYRDGKLLGAQAADLIIDWRQPARGSYLEWGLGTGKAEALVERIAYDLSGPYQ